MAAWDALINRYKAAQDPKYVMDPEIQACAYESLLPAPLRSKLQALEHEMPDLAAMKAYVTKQLNSMPLIDASSQSGTKSGGKTYLLDGTGADGNQQQAEAWANWGADEKGKANLSEEEQRKLPKGESLEMVAQRVHPYW